MVIHPEGIFYPQVKKKHIAEDKIVEAIKGYRNGEFNKKWILGQMQEP